MISVGRKVYLERIRIIAIILVVLHHIDINHYYYHNTNNPVTFIVSLVVTVLCRMDVTLFFMVSGALLLGKNESIKDLYKKRVLRMSIVLLVFSTLQYFVKILRYQIENSSLKDFVIRFFSGNIQDTYWFLYAYIGILMIMPFLRKLAQGMNEMEFKYLFWLRVFFDVAFTINGSLSVSLIDNSWGSCVQVISSYLWYFLMGFYFENKKSLETEESHWAKYALCLAVGVAIPVMIISIHYVLSGELLDDYVGITTAFSAVSMFVLIKKIYIHNDDNRCNKLIVNLGSLVFGVYLTEYFARSLLKIVYIRMTECTVGIIASGVYCIFTLVISFALSVFMHLIPGIKKII